MKEKYLVVWTGLLLTLSATAWGAPSKTVQSRLQQVSALFVENPSVPDGLFHADFLAQVPAVKVEAICKDFYDRGGRVIGTRIVEEISEYKVKVVFTTDRGMTFPGIVGLFASDPWEINNLWVGGIAPGIDSLDDGIAKLRELGGAVSFSLMRLDGAEPQPVAQLQPERPLAIGSAFKLFILGELMDIIARGKYRWKTLARVRDKRKSWPSGFLHDWPDGSPLTLQSLASLMISQSDNTATDLLLFILGRRNVEQQQAQMGLAHPKLNQPFLSTKEMFLIKNRNQQTERVRDYVALDEAGRRAYLLNELSIIRKEDVELDLTGVVAIDKVEWFASTADLCRAMGWLKRHTAAPGGQPARELLSINTGLSFDKKKWRYIGFKGGSEPGVLNLTWLLQRADGQWFALSATWNDKTQPLDEQSFTGIVQSLITFLGES